MQERVFAFLTDPATHPHVHRIDTHAASVFLEGDRALKIKRAIRFPFLDYSTLAKRKAACDEEIRINRQFAPQIYRRVVPITQGGDGSLEIDGKGDAGRICRRNEPASTSARPSIIWPKPVRSIPVSSTPLRTRSRPPTSSRRSRRPNPGSIRFRASSRTIPRHSGKRPAFPPMTSTISGRPRCRRLRGVRGLLEQRGRQGFVRRCHGDLHLANIVLIDGKPVLFDAIEFDPVIASVDVLYDLAFPMMDFIRYGRQAAANALLNRYLGMTSDENLDALAALPLFMSLRAAIRANVLLARLGRTSGDKADVMQSARAYFELARTTDPSTGAGAGRGRRVVRDRKIRAGARARAFRHAAAGSRGVAYRRAAQAAIQGRRNGSAARKRLPAGDYRADLRNPRAARRFAILLQGHSVVVDAVFARRSGTQLRSATPRAG